MQDAKRARNIFDFHTAFGFEKTDIVVRPGRRIVFQGHLARIVSVTESLATIKFDNYETLSVTLIENIRGMREITSRESFDY